MEQLDDEAELMVAEQLLLMEQKLKQKKQPMLKPKYLPSINKNDLSKINYEWSQKLLSEVGAEDPVDSAGIDQYLSDKFQQDYNLEEIVSFSLTPLQNLFNLSMVNNKTLQSC